MSAAIRSMRSLILSTPCDASWISTPAAAKAPRIACISMYARWSTDSPQPWAAAAAVASGSPSKRTMRVWWTVTVSDAVPPMRVSRYVSGCPKRGEASSVSHVIG